MFADDVDFLRRKLRERVDHQRNVGDQPGVAGVRRRSLRAPLARETLRLARIGGAEQRAEFVECRQAIGDRPMARVLESVGDAEEQIRDGHLLPGGVGKQRNA